MTRLTLKVAAVLLSFVTGAWAAPPSPFPAAPVARATRPDASRVGGGALSHGDQEAAQEASSSVSPDEVARLVNESKAAWDKRQVARAVDLRPVWRKLGIPAGGFEGGCTGGDCEAAVFRHELDGEPGLESVLKLMRPLSDSCRYMVFTRAGAGVWKLLGHVDHDFNRYEMSRHRVASAGGRNWLVVRGQEGSGTGYSLYGETWYGVGAGGVRPVLHYPVEGHVSSWPAGLSRALKARVVAPRRAVDEKAAITILFTVTYYVPVDSETDASLTFVNRHHARYAWDDAARKFVFDVSRSDITPQEIGAVVDLQFDPAQSQQIGGTTFSSDGGAYVRGGCEVFLKYNLRGLSKFAASGSRARREWLRRFLEDCGDTPEKKTLEDALR